MVFKLAQKHKIALGYASVQALRRAYDFHDLQSFLDIYYAGMKVLRDESDFFAMTYAYLKKVHQQGVVHVEIFFDPQAHMARGISYDTVLTGISLALAEGRHTFGISARLILCFLRHLSADDAMRTLEAALPRKHLIMAVGLDSSELGNPPSKFEAVFARAREHGLAAVAHAGEEGPPSYIREALDILHVLRIDHGVRCEEDPALCERLVRDQIPLTVCPLSNTRLHVFDDMAMHNLKRLMEQGLCVTVNSDDPAYFGGYLLENFLAVQSALDLKRDDIAHLAKNAFAGSFLPQEQKRAWLSSVDAYAARHA